MNITKPHCAAEKFDDNILRNAFNIGGICSDYLGNRFLLPVLKMWLGLTFGEWATLASGNEPDVFMSRNFAKVTKNI